MKYLMIVLIAYLFSGCAALWESVSIGKLHGKAEESGLNYEDTGVVADPYFLYVNRKNINQAAIYPNSNCRDERKNQLLIEGANNE